MSIKGFLRVIFAIYIVWAPLFSGVGPGQSGERYPGDLSGVFFLQGDFNLRVSIDTGWERGGWTPVFLTFAGLEVCQRVKSDDLASAAGIETGMCKMLAEDMNLDFLIYEHNPLRTRMKLIDKSPPLQLKFKPGNKRVDFYIGKNRLNLDTIRVTFAGITPGEQFELIFAGPNVHTHKRFIYMPSRGVIYASSRRVTTGQFAFDPVKDKEWSVWAVKSVPEQEKRLRREEKK